jgi:hypothetical protein
MKRRRYKKAPLVVEHLENIARTAIKRYPEIVTQFARGRSGVYALYSGDSLYYVGLARNLRSRLHGHIRDRHAEEWDRFSIYLTQGDEHLRELESLVLRIASPKGNRVSGKISASRDLFRVFRNRIVQSQRRELTDITGGALQKVSSNRDVRRRRGEYDTLVCPAHKDGFDEEFLGKNRWYAIRISKHVIPRLKYIAIYVSAPIRQVTHYGRIRKIRLWRKSGKYIVLLKGRPKRIGPVDFSPKVNIQAPRLALMDRLKRARTLADVL